MGEEVCSSSVRVRGVYSTALAELLLERGFCLSDMSEKILRRLRDTSHVTSRPPEATVKSDDRYRDIIVLVGEPGVVERLYAVLREVLQESLFTKIMPLNAVYRGKVENKISHNECLVTTPLGLGGVLRESICFPGQTLDLTIIGYSDDLKTPIVKRGVTVVGRYMLLNESGVSQFSEHIRDPDVIGELKSFSEIIVRQGFGVKWRSSAKNSTTIDLMNEYEELKKRFDEIKNSLDKTEINRFVYVGESIAFIHVSPDDMLRLDEYRSKIIATTPYHHTMRSYSSLGDLIDLLDHVTEDSYKTNMCRGLKHFLIDKMLEGYEVYLYHRRPFYSKEIVIGPARALYADLYERDNSRFLRAVLSRVSKSEGLYDGLEIPREPGDKIVSLIDDKNEFILHGYYSSSLELKGVYVNINTRPHVIYDIDPRSFRGRIKVVYNDLYIDVIVLRGESRVVDEREFSELCDNNMLSERACSRFRDLSRRAFERHGEIYSIFNEKISSMLRENRFDRDSVDSVFESLERIFYE
ncbi:MAG: DUF402 domain-containing protein [Sulfolobales archaeon]